MKWHSAGYITSQPPMPRRFWEASVLKMKDKFGAPIPETSVKDLVDYFAETNGAE